MAGMPRWIGFVVLCGLVAIPMDVTFQQLDAVFGSTWFVVAIVVGIVLLALREWLWPVQALPSPADRQQ